MITELNDPAGACDAIEFKRRAARAAQGNDMGAEYNFGAGAIMEANGKDVVAASAVARLGELVILDKALIEEGHCWPWVPSWWIYKAYDAGWRFRADKGFHRLAPDFTLTEA